MQWLQLPKIRCFLIYMVLILKLGALWPAVPWGRLSLIRILDSNHTKGAFYWVAELSWGSPWFDFIWDAKFWTEMQLMAEKKLIIGSTSQSHAPGISIYWSKLGVPETLHWVPKQWWKRCFCDCCQIGQEKPDVHVYRYIILRSERICWYFGSLCKRKKLNQLPPMKLLFQTENKTMKWFYPSSYSKNRWKVLK